MSESDSVSRPVHRSAGIVLGGLAGALVGAAIAAQPAQAAQPVQPAEAKAAVASASIADQFRDAFAPGAVDREAHAVAIVINPPDPQ